jgi:CubicO group peptidase (beta-lactamase class C family)
MIRFLSTVAALLGIVSTTASLAAAPAQPPPPAMTSQDVGAFLDGIMPYAIRRANIAGGVVAVVKDGRLIFASGYGYSDIAKRAPVVPDQTLFRIGSVSKLFTWTSVMQLVQAGKIDLDANVNQYLDFKIPEKYGPITMRDLMTHTPGFSEVIRDLFVKKPYPLREYLVNHIPDEMFKPFTTIAYSNYGAALAGYIVQRVSGEPYATYLQRHIFTPLGMAHSTFVQPLPKSLEPLMAKGYTTAADSKPSPFEVVEAAPAGSGTSTAIDMTHFMLAYLQGGQYRGNRILAPATIKQMWTRQVSPAPGMPGYDLGFYQEDRNGQTIVGHAGDTGVFHTDLHLLPKQNVGIFMSFNSAGTAGAVEQVRTEIFRAFLDRYFPYTAPVERTVSNPKPDAARVAGWYQSSRREDRALQLFYALGQSQVTALPNGEVEVSELRNLAGDQRRWREVAPLYYRQVDGQAHLKFVADSSGNIVSFDSDDFIPVEVAQRVNGLRALGSLKTLLTCFVIILLLNLIIGVGTWIARWRLGLKLDMTRGQRWIRALARIGAAIFLLEFVAWPTILSGSALLSPSLGSTVTLLYVLGVLAILGGIAMIVEALLRIRQGPGGPGGWLVIGGKSLVGLAAIYGIWVILSFGLANFVTNF